MKIEAPWKFAASAALIVFSFMGLWYAMNDTPANYNKMFWASLFIFCVIIGLVLIYNQYSSVPEQSPCPPFIETESEIQPSSRIEMKVALNRILLSPVNIPDGLQSIVEGVRQKLREDSSFSKRSLGISQEQYKPLTDLLLKMGIIKNGPNNGYELTEDGLQWVNSNE